MIVIVAIETDKDPDSITEFLNQELVESAMIATDVQWLSYCEQPIDPNLSFVAKGADTSWIDTLRDDLNNLQMGMM